MESVESLSPEAAVQQHHQGVRAVAVGQVHVDEAVLVPGIAEHRVGQRGRPAEHVDVGGTGHGGHGSRLAEVMA